MTRNTCAKCGMYVENPLPDEPRAKGSEDRNPLVPTIPSTGSNMLLWKAVAFAGGLALALYSGPLHAAPSSGGDTVQGLYDTLLSTMKNGRTLGQSGRFTQLEPVIRRSFDVPAMARLSVGSSWAGLSEAQRQQMTESFGRYISAIYAERFDTFTGQKLASLSG